MIDTDKSVITYLSVGHLQQIEQLTIHQAKLKAIDVRALT